MGSHRRSSDTSAPELRSKLRRVVSGHEQMKIAFPPAKISDPNRSLPSGRGLRLSCNSIDEACRSQDGGDGERGPIHHHHHPSKHQFSSPEFRIWIVGSEPSLCERRDLRCQGRHGRQARNGEAKRSAGSADPDSQTNRDSSQRSPGHMVQTLTHRRLYLHKFFHRAIDYLSTVDRVDHQTFRISVLKLLRAAFHEVGAVLGSVESDVEELLQDLGAQMCDPMVEYVEVLRLI
ncbi:hypothetical protein Pyn_28630 [Prunus yedoensis var. nudiflora]|uniref:Uncharacterized protein n=1 Tax=Prunus yedoensis var. nudiflora TaxID=2094558 RepID=A0A314ZL60_PRUYE|nr:hypothetical protein Pyn_28630 [Prunus yedoensis var. nudiflora]